MIGDKLGYCVGVADVGVFGDYSKSFADGFDCGWCFAFVLHLDKKV